MGFVEVPLGSRIDRDLAEWDEGLAGLAGSAGPFQPVQAGREGSNAGKSSLTMRHHRPGRPTGHQPRSIVPSGPPQALPMPLHSIQPSLHMNHACHMQRELLCLVESGGRLPDAIGSSQQLHPSSKRIFWAFSRGVAGKSTRAA
jgi:hypothetical protein